VTALLQRLRQLAMSSVQGLLGTRHWNGTSRT